MMGSRDLALSLAAVALVVACQEPTNKTQGAASASASASSSAPTKPKLDKAALAAVIQALPASADAKPPASMERVELGKWLYFEARLSKNQDVSCNSCHKLDKFGVDNKPTSEGHKKQLGGRNSPTVLNAALEFRQFWDGRAADVEEQATMPITNPIEMASDEKRVVAVLSSIPEYVEAFKKAFPDDKNAITLKNVGIAIGSWERKLLTPSRLDKYLAGDESALSEDEKTGAATFLANGCPTCHMGPLIGGSVYQKAGLIKPWPNQKDQGRFEVTKQEADKMFFKVPSLRNVEKTAPYFHDGATATLEEAVTMMARHQLGKELKADELKAIVTFLKTTTAAPPAEIVAPPTLPKSTAKTPKPDPT